MEMYFADPSFLYIAAAIAILFAFIVGYGVRYFTLSLRQARNRDEQLKKSEAVDHRAPARVTSQSTSTKEVVKLKSLEEEKRRLEGRAREE